MKIWNDVEVKFLSSPYKIYKWKLSQKIRLVATSIILLAFIEHFLFLSNSAVNQYHHVHNNNISVENPLAYFLQNQFGFIFNYLPFYVEFGIFNEIINMTFTFGWNYMELFIMITSLGLFTRFEQLNDRMHNFSGKVGSSIYWFYTNFFFFILKKSWHHQHYFYYYYYCYIKIYIFR
jgi:gustatory receptor